ncbi:acetyl/propionyl/methylcrotonyl-CoA carboxylase subunit alpha [Candidatus Riflebacteria bacterium]
MIKKILIANRGEIALRIINTCRDMGISPVLVFSEADKKSLPVLKADEAYYIGAAPPSESYLNIEKILEVAKKTGVDAIHPGYGFLAENPDFALACEEAGLVFIGPHADVIKLMGCKTKARELMQKNEIPVIPGMLLEGDNPNSQIENAEALGFPLLIKAAYGGGGKGMSIVTEQKELKGAIESARRVALKAFGNDTVYIEKYIENARHIEFQVFCDEFDNVLHLNERECSIQRRHQKIIEETPSTALNAELRQAMGETACKVCRVSGYRNAGTVEFVLDEKGNFYFLEMNTRIQVEHPVTELTLGIDLIAWQILISSFKKLEYRQSDINSRGHAIECRIYAEDPANNYFPSAGKIHYLREPSGPGIRNDCGVYSGDTVSIHYDPMISKLITYGPDRECARMRMLAALNDYPILGIKSNITFLRDLLSHKDFIKGRTFTNFIDTHFPDWKVKKMKDMNPLLMSIAAWESMQKKVGQGGPKMEEHDILPDIGDFEIGKQSI